MDLKSQDEAAIFAEYQNEPLPEDAGTDEAWTADAWTADAWTADAWTDEAWTDEAWTADEISRKINRVQRDAVPISCNRLNMFIDVQTKPRFLWLRPGKLTSPDTLR